MVEVGSVETFDKVLPDKAQAVKIAEETCEVYSAWERWRDSMGGLEETRALLDECADVIQATCNLVAALGVEDMRPSMRRCEDRNRRRGRIGGGHDRG